MSAKLKDKLEKRDIADLLFKKYSLLKAEVHLQINSQKNRVRNVQIVAYALATGVTYVFLEGKYVPSDTNMFVWAAGLLVAICLVFYLIYDAIDPYYEIGILGERMATLEKKINDIAGAKLLVWEQDLSEKVHSGLNPFPGVFQPLWLVMFYVMVLLVLVIIIGPIVLCCILWQVPLVTYVGLKKAFIAFDAVWSLGSTLVLFYTGRGVLTRLRPEARAKIRSAIGEENM